ncbi:MAG: hypothetical protein FJ104_11775, partial [Deltaproteobacteria bacterium]|nr:hypothetical protein [Deltaproteobacteria bacterium]
MSSEAQTGTRHQYVAIGLVAASMLMHEILLTRVCALRLYFHFAFLVISNCLLGLGASGALLVRYQSEWKAEPRRHLTRFSLAYTASLVGTYFFLLRFPIPENLDLGDTPQLLTLTIYNLAGAVPFLFGGLVIGMLLTFHVERASRLYAVDLIGAGIGCIACPALLPLVGGGGVFLVSTLLALAGTFALGRPYFSRGTLGGLAAAGLLGIALVPTLDQRMPVPSKGLLDYAKAMDQALKLGEPFSVWTANSRIDMFRMPPGAGVGVFMRGTNTEGLPTNVPSAGIAQDATAGTSLLDYSGHPEALEHLRRSM